MDCGRVGREVSLRHLLAMFLLVACSDGGDKADTATPVPVDDGGDGRPTDTECPDDCCYEDCGSGSYGGSGS